MRFLKACKLAVLSLWANRIRALFSMLGVVIGVLAIILLVAIGIGAKRTVVQQMSGLGPQQITVVPGRLLNTDQGNLLGGMTNVSSTLTYADAKEIARQPSIKSVTPHLETVLRASYGKQMVEGIVTGVTPSYQQVLQVEVSVGRFLTAQDEKGKQRVVVLGSSIEKALLGEEANKQDATLVGQEIVLKGQAFQVIGVLQTHNMIGSNANNSIILPISVALETTTMKNLSKIYVQAKSKQLIPQAQKEIFKAVRKRHAETDFSIIEQTEMRKITDKITKVLRVMIAGIAGMAFIISGIGIMNVMVMSVRERTREIGVRKTLGAGTLDILYQFFLETLLLTAVGGVVGLLLGYAIIEIWNANVAIFQLVVPAWAVKLALGSSLVTGCIFGIYPAWQASRLQPSHAIRYGD